MSFQRALVLSDDFGFLCILKEKFILVHHLGSLSANDPTKSWIPKHCLEEFQVIAIAEIPIMVETGYDTFRSPDPFGA